LKLQHDHQMHSVFVTVMHHNHEGEIDGANRMWREGMSSVTQSGTKQQTQGVECTLSSMES